MTDATQFFGLSLCTVHYMHTYCTTVYSSICAPVLLEGNLPKYTSLKMPKTLSLNFAGTAFVQKKKNLSFTVEVFKGGLKGGLKWVIQLPVMYLEFFGSFFRDMQFFFFSF